MNGFFSDDKGNRSSLRLIFIFGMFWLMALITFVICLKAWVKGFEVSWAEITTFLSITAGIMTGGKIIQKSQENEGNTPMN